MKLMHFWSIITSNCSVAFHHTHNNPSINYQVNLRHYTRVVPCCQCTVDAWFLRLYLALLVNITSICGYPNPNTGLTYMVVEFFRKYFLLWTLVFLEHGKRVDDRVQSLWTCGIIVIWIWIYYRQYMDIFNRNKYFLFFNTACNE